MPRPHKIWYWKARGEWCVKINGKRTRLGTDREKAKTKFHELMLNSDKPVSSSSFSAVLDAFLDWTEANRAQRTYERYSELLQSFLDFAGDTPISSIKPFTVTQWCESHAWNQTTQNTAIRAIKRALNWAETMGYCHNPIARMPAPKPLRRETVVSPENFDKLLTYVHDSFADLLIVSYDSGTRPQEITLLRPEHIQLDKCRAVLPSKEAKKGIPRAIYFPTDRSMEIIKRLMQKEGLLFTNTRGKKWTRSAIKCRFARLEEKTGRRFRMYDFRRTWITRKIIAGVDSHVVAQLAGHKSTAMLDKHYSVIAEDHQFMLDSARRGAST